MTDHNERDSSRRLARLLARFGEWLTDASDEEVLRDLKVSSEDSQRVSEEVRFAVDGAIDRFYCAQATALRERLGPYSSSETTKASAHCITEDLKLGTCDADSVEELPEASADSDSQDGVICPHGYWHQRDRDAGH